MRLEALAAGSGADHSLISGMVHSVFARACNIVTASGTLTGLVAREVGAVPRGYQLASPAGFDFRIHVDVAAPVSCRAAILRFDRSDLAIDLRRATPWLSRLGAYPIDCTRSDIAAAWRSAWELLVAHAGATSFAHQAREAVATLFYAARYYRAAAARRSVLRLIGLGDGLTPAGDDFLIGFLAGLASLPTADGQDTFRSALADQVRANAPRTGDISRLYLAAAAESEVSQPLAELAAAIGMGDTHLARTAAAAALAVGASSGAAASYGLLLAVRTLEPAIPPPTLLC